MAKLINAVKEWYGLDVKVAGPATSRMVQLKDKDGSYVLEILPKAGPNPTIQSSQDVADQLSAKGVRCPLVVQGLDGGAIQAEPNGVRVRLTRVSTGQRLGDAPLSHALAIAAGSFVARTSSSLAGLKGVGPAGWEEAWTIGLDRIASAMQAHEEGNDGKEVAELVRRAGQQLGAAGGFDRKHRRVTSFKSMRLDRLVLAEDGGEVAGLGQVLDELVETWAVCAAAVGMAQAMVLAAEDSVLERAAAFYAGYCVSDTLVSSERRVLLPLVGCALAKGFVEAKADVLTGGAGAAETRVDRYRSALVAFMAADRPMLEAAVEKAASRHRHALDTATTS